MTKYNETDNKKTLEAEDDAATRNWGNGCRIPTRDECEKLYTTAGFTWTKVADSGSLKGYRITGPTTGNTNSIFLPATGYHSEDKAYKQLEVGYYWSSSRDPDSSSYGYALFFSNGSKNNDYNFEYIFTNYRCSGITVRPVAEK